MNNKIKPGDIVTQNFKYYYFWNDKKFNVQITKIDGELAFLKNEIIITHNTNNEKKLINSINIDYLKVNISETRKQKLIKINE